MIYEVADHVEPYWYAQTRGFDSTILVSKKEPCNETAKCKKCLNKKESTDVAVTQLSPEKNSDPRPSTSGVKKPYTFARSRINLTIEDLENSSEDEDFDPISMYL